MHRATSALNELRDLTERLKGKRDACVQMTRNLEGQITERDVEISNLRNNQERYRKAVILAELVIDKAQTSVVERFENVLTLALRTVFDSTYAFKITTSSKWNQPVADFGVISDGLTEPINPIDAKGGGVSDIVALGLRIALSTILEIDGPWGLDEPTKHLSGGRAPDVCRFLRLISQKTQRQIIIITHSKEFEETADNIIEL